MKLYTTLFFCFIIFSNQILKAQAAPELEKGKIIPSVVCLEDKEQSYALYLPKAYDKAKKWPIIIGFSPAARGTDPVGICSEAAEKFGFIVIGSNNSRNGSSESINKAFQALKKEIEKRYSIDAKRIYAIGMSGGSRVALRFAAQEPDYFRGVIACAAFFNPADSFKDTYLYGIVGDQDFNYSEYKRGVPILEKAKTSFWIEIYQGIHQWPAKERVAEAIEMFDYLFQKNGPDKGAALAEKIINNRMTRIEQMITQKMWAHAGSEVESLLRNFETNPLAEKIKILKKKLEDLPEYQVDKKAEEDFIVCALKIKQPEESPAFWEMFTKVLALSKENSRIGNLAKGTLASLSDGIKSSYKDISESKTIPPAQKGLYFNVAHLANSGDARVPCVASFFYAQAKDKSKTLSLLADAAKLGFNDPASIQNDKEFEFVKDEPEFIAAIKKITENKVATDKEAPKK